MLSIMAGIIAMDAAKLVRPFGMNSSIGALSLNIPSCNARIHLDSIKVVTLQSWDHDAC